MARKYNLSDFEVPSPQELIAQAEQTEQEENELEQEAKETPKYQEPTTPTKPFHEIAAGFDMEAEIKESSKKPRGYSSRKSSKSFSGNGAYRKSSGIGG